MDVVDRAEDAAGLELPPLVVREPLENFLDAHGIGDGRVEAARIGEGHSNITFLVRRGDARVVLPRTTSSARRACCAGSRARRPGFRWCWRSATTRACSACPST